MPGSRLFRKTLAVMVVGFGVISVAMSLLYALELRRNMRAEFESKGRAIGQSIADAGVELLLNRDVETIQATIDQYTEIPGVSYVAVQDGDGSLIAHTFVPEVPPALRGLERDGEARLFELPVEGVGDTLHITTPMLGGVAGHVDVGMDIGLIRARIWSGVLRLQLLIGALFLASVGVAALLVRRIARPLVRLAEHTRALAAGGFEAGGPPLDAATLAAEDEVGDLARSLDGTSRELRASIERLREATAARERLESELRIAREIQMGILPKGEPRFPNLPLRVDASVHPAREVGGDFYDFFLTEDERLYFAIGDVSGKGVPAALLMAVTATLLRNAARSSADPARILAQANRELSRDNDSGMFVTVFLGFLEARTGRVAYCNGGHNPPYLVAAGAPPRAIQDGRGALLGWSSGTAYHSSELILAPGQSLFLYTDGVTEANDPSGALFTERRLEALLSRDIAGPPAALTAAVLRAVGAFAGAGPPADDVTVMALRFGPEGAAP
jgi:serine phosphatase RsbU (regulator of sigma subunit)